MNVQFFAGHNICSVARAAAGFRLRKYFLGSIRFNSNSTVQKKVELLAYSCKRHGSASETLKKWSAKLQSFLTQAATTKPKPPADYRRESPTGCDCKFCRQRKSFLENANQKKIRIPAAERHREHLELVISRQSLDVTTKTIRSGSPFSLELTKTIASHETRVQKYHSDLKLLDQLK